MHELWLPDFQFVFALDFGKAGTEAGEWTKTAINILAGGLSAVIGGFAGSYLSEKFAREKRKADQVQSEKSSAFALQIQLMGMYSDLTQCREHLGQSRVAFRGREVRHGFRAQYHQAFAGDQAKVNFRVEDIQALGSYGSESLLNLIADLDRRFNGIAEALNIYRKTWLDLSDQMSGEVRGNLLHMSLTEEEIRRLNPKLAAQTRLLEDIEPMVDEMVQDTYQALLGLYQARVKAHGLAKSFEAIAPNGKYVVIAPDPDAPPPLPRSLADRS